MDIFEVTNAPFAELNGTYEIQLEFVWPCTYCVLRKIEPEWEEPVAGAAILHPLEKFNEEMGEKIALRRAVESLFNSYDLYEVLGHPETLYDKYLGTTIARFLGGWRQSKHGN